MIYLTRQGVPFAFGLEEIKAFEVLKVVVIKELVLKKWCPELPTKVEIDAFNGIIGGIFS